MRHSLPSNLPPAEAGRLRLLNILSTKEAEFSRTLEGISNTTRLIEESQIAIHSIENTLEQSRAALASYEESLRSLQTSIPPNDVLINTSKQTVSIKDLQDDICRQVVDFIRSNDAKERRRLEEQEKTLQGNIGKLKSMIHDLTIESHDRYREVAIMNSAFLSMERLRDDLKATIEDINRILSPIRRVPTEIWEAVFRFYVQRQLVIYQDLRGHLPQHPAFLLTHVCRLWRNIAINSPFLWDYVPAHQFMWWPMNTIELFRRQVKRSTTEHGVSLPRRTILFNFAYNPKWKIQALECAKLGDGKPRANPRGSNRGSLNTSQRQFAKAPQLLPALAYDVLLLDRADDFNGSRASCSKDIPFKTPHSLTLRLTPSTCSYRIKPILVQFPDIEHLTLLNVSPAFLGDSPLSELKRLSYLMVDTGQYTSHSVGYLLVPTLEELHLSYRGTTAWPPLQRRIELRELHTLGITLEVRGILTHLDVSSLKTLVLYHSPLTSSTIDFKPTWELLDNIAHLQFEGWQKDGNGNQCLFILGLYEQASRVPRVTFRNCDIDAYGLICFLNKMQSERPTMANEMQIEMIRCTGVTQADCEVIREVAARLDVYA